MRSYTTQLIQTPMNKILSLLVTTTLLTFFCTPSHSLESKNSDLLHPTINSEDAAFAAGERLEFFVSYKVGFITLDVATVLFTTSDTTYNGKDAYHIRAIAETRPKYEWVFKLKDIYNTYLDMESLRPLYFYNDLSEDSYRFKSNYLYNWDSMKVTTTSRNLSKPDDVINVFDLTEVSYDAVALFYNIRSIDITDKKVGEKYPLEVVFYNKIRKVRYTYMGSTTKKVRGIGSINCLEFKCELASSTGESFNDGDEFTLWVTDDNNRIPVYVYSPIRVGSVRARLVNYEGLKYGNTLPMSE